MNVSAVPSVDKVTATSDFELKLVVTRFEGTASVLIGVPSVLIEATPASESDAT